MNQQRQAGRSVIVIVPTTGSIGPRKSMRQVLASAVWVATSVVLAALSLMQCTSAWSQSQGGTTSVVTKPGLGSGVDLDAQDGLGSGTRALLSLQVSGAAAGPQQPMTGDATTAAYKRYTDSFTHPVPEFFQQRVRSDSSSGS